MLRAPKDPTQRKGTKSFAGGKQMKLPHVRRRLQRPLERRKAAQLLVIANSRIRNRNALTGSSVRWARTMAATGESPTGNNRLPVEAAPGADKGSWPMPPEHV